jgi:dienelactone hydrolase
MLTGTMTAHRRSSFGAIEPAYASPVVDEHQQPIVDDGVDTAASDNAPVNRRALLAAAVLSATACQHHPLADPSASRPSFAVRVPLPRLGFARHRSATLWVARPAGVAQRPLVLHLSGDSGRHGFDLLLFTALTRWGYPVALMSSPAWADSLPMHAASPQELARDLDTLRRAAARAAGLPEEDAIVLLGQSRGAGLAVEAAAEPLLRRRLRGVVALGLCADEMLVRRDGRVALPYRDKALTGELALEVIQSTHDRFLDAAAGRKAFGVDTERQRFHAIDARSHTFVGARDALLDQLRESLETICRR